MASSECISEKPSTSAELTQDDVSGASLNEPFHGILKVRTFTPTQANGEDGRFQNAIVLFFSHKKVFVTRYHCNKELKNAFGGCTPDVTALLIMTPR